ncbi:NAD(P)H-dependent oxidoreductase [Paenibacillus sp. MBLB4367]|uniref:NAD(P)H-dependent oxidoreductase n=1 Tax=Paenibacillus sp. MBLB4367 TaxID=3384767 RepID=UPI0039083744
MMKKILVIQGNPSSDSLGSALASAYADGARGSGADVSVLDLSQLSFNPNLAGGYKRRTELEPDLVRAQELIREAEHLVFVYPVWWGTMPALLKGFIDRVFLPGFAFKYRKGSMLWDKLLKGKSARLIVTLDTPVWYYYLVQGKPGHNAMKKTTLEFCGVKPVRTTNIGPVRQSSDERRSGYLTHIRKLGAAMG